MVFIPYANTYTVTTTGSVMKFVDCESCKGEYVYKLTREGKGEGTDMLFLDNKGAIDRAEQEARSLMVARLAKSCDPVPCPMCGWYQQQMVERMRYHHHRWMVTAGVFSFPIALFWSLFAMAFTTTSAPGNHNSEILFFWTLTAFFALATPALWVGKYYLARNYFPNNKDVERRLELGRDRAMTKLDFMKMQKSQGS
jgi:hypothetical protein